MSNQTRPFGDPGTDEFLAHYGVQGMRWGHRTARPSPSSPSKKPQVTSRDIKDARKGLLERRNQEAMAQTTKKGRNSIFMLGEFSKHLSPEYRADPRRAVAFAQTRGEKAIHVILAVPSSGLSLGIMAGDVALNRTIKKGQQRAAASLSKS